MLMDGIYPRKHVFINRYGMKETCLDGMRRHENSGAWEVSVPRIAASAGVVLDGDPVLGKD